MIEEIKTFETYKSKKDEQFPHRQELDRRHFLLDLLNNREVNCDTYDICKNTLRHIYRDLENCNPKVSIEDSKVIFDCPEHNRIFVVDKKNCFVSYDSDFLTQKLIVTETEAFYQPLFEPKSTLEPTLAQTRGTKSQHLWNRFLMKLMIDE